MDKKMMKMRWVPKLSQPLPRFFTDHHVILPVETSLLGSGPISESYFPLDRIRLEAANLNLLFQVLDVKQRTAEVSVKGSKNTVCTINSDNTLHFMKMR